MPASAHLNELIMYFHTHNAELLRIFCGLVKRSGIAVGRWAIEWEARDIFSEVKVAAQPRSDEFAASADPDLWLVKLALPSLEKRKLLAMRLRPHAVRRGLIPAKSARVDVLKDEEAFDVIIDAVYSQSGSFLESDMLFRSEFDRMLSRLHPTQRFILDFAIAHKLGSEALGEALGCTPGMARLQFHDAFNRLRRVWNKK